jgi:cation diffusion facilitator CzcD-associated flavoprotein CzcO
VPGARRLVRAGLYWVLEAAGAAVLNNRIFARVLTGMAGRHLRRGIADPALRAALTPGYPIGCKRILVSDDYYPTLTRPNVALVTAPIRRIVRDGVETTDGMLHACDTIVFATGFRVADPEGLPRIEGLGGRVLAEQWRREGMAAHLGTHVAGYPNLAFLLGPNSGPASASAIHVMESQLRRIVPYVAAIRDAAPGTALDVDAARQHAYNDDLQARLRATAWHGGCSSWYLDRTGRNTTMYPGLTSAFRRRVGRFDASDYLWRMPGDQPC